MILVTGSNQGYYYRMDTFFQTLRQHADFPCYYVAVGFEPPSIPGIVTVSITKEQNHGAPPETECIQHGSFLHAVGGVDGDVILYCDGDLRMQRKLTVDERHMLALKHNEVLVGYNGGEHETLMIEAARLGPRVSKEQVVLDWPGARGYSAFNVGCVAMTRRTWQRVHDWYVARWDAIGETFIHQARQQWLLSWLFEAMDFNIHIMPWSFHAHGHHGHKPGMTVDDNGVHINGELALFRHFV